MKKQQFDKKELSILALDELFKDIGKTVKAENSTIKQQLEALLKPSREISKLVKDIKIKNPKLYDFLK